MKTTRMIRKTLLALLPIVILASCETRSSYRESSRYYTVDALNRAEYVETVNRNVEDVRRWQENSAAPTFMPLSR